VVAVGVATGLEHEVQDRPVAGDQLYVDAPAAVSVDELPVHIADWLALAVTVGFGFTVTVTIPVSVQPLPSVPVTI